MKGNRPCYIQEDPGDSIIMTHHQNMPKNIARARIFQANPRINLFMQQQFGLWLSPVYTIGIASTHRRIVWIDWDSYFLDKCITLYKKTGSFPGLLISQNMKEWLWSINKDDWTGNLPAQSALIVPISNTKWNMSRDNSDSLKSGPLNTVELNKRN